MNYSWNSIACLQCCHWSGDEITAMIVFNRPVVITFFNILCTIKTDECRWNVFRKTVNEIKKYIFKLGVNGSNRMLMNNEWMNNALICLLYVSESVIKTSTSMIESILFKVMSLTILQNRSKNCNFTYGFATKIWHVF